MMRYLPELIKFYLMERVTKMGEVIVKLDLRKFIDSVKETGEVGAADLIIDSLVNPSDADLEILISEFPYLIERIDTPSSRLIQVAMRENPNLVPTYQDEFEKLSGSVKSEIYDQLSEGYPHILGRLTNVPEEYIDKALQIDPSCIWYFLNISPKYQLMGVHYNPDLYRLIRNPSEDVVNYILGLKRETKKRLADIAAYS